MPVIQRRQATLRHIFACLAVLMADAAKAEEVEVLHYWQPSSASTLLLKEMVKKEGHTWKDFVIVPGGTNGLLNSLLKLRVRSGNPPFAALVRAPVARQWAREGQLTSLDEAAQAGQWDKILPRAIRDAVKQNDRYVAVPVDIYRENWLWVNNRLLQRAGATAPADWPAFFEAAEKLRRAGIVAVGYGGQPRGNLHLFATVALGIGGPDFFRRAFVQHELGALSGAVMEEVLRTFRRIKPYTKAGVVQREWQEVSQDLIEGRAAMMFMGDWTAPQLSAAQPRPGADFQCLPTPGSAGAYTYVIDSFALFRTTNPEKTRAQQAFAAGLLSPDIQVRFNLALGAIPVREGSDLARFDACRRESAAAFRKAEETGVLVPSLALALSASVEVAVADVVTAFWNDDSMTPKTAAELLLAVMK